VPPTPTPEQLAALDAKRPAWTKEEDQYIIDYMNWVFARDPLASTTEIMRKIAANVGHYLTLCQLATVISLSCLHPIVFPRDLMS
jgi:hypothetical protein